MGNSLRCCLACVIPCGALDLIRIVHLNGFVEEITGPVTAGEILKANPNHVLSKPSSQGQGVVRKILILSPESELKRGGIYFLIPSSSLPADKKKTKKPSKPKRSSSGSSKNIKHDDVDINDHHHHHDLASAVNVSEKKSKSSRRDRRSGTRVGVWRPHLASISED